MKIKQWEDKHLSHFSYAVISDCEKKIVLIDPARDPQPYLEYASKHDAQIIGVIETHPHADFVSSHLEIHTRTGATIYASKLVKAFYQHQSFDEGDSLKFGKIRLYPLNTPGHSPDSISIVLEHEQKPMAVFTGDTLFIGDCGRPDLREGAGNIKAAKRDLAKQMFHSLREKLMRLPDNVTVYPAHGAGSLCGKALSEAHSSTIGAEKMTNWSLQEMPEETFIEQLLADQPFIPAYFPYDVELNRKGAPALKESLSTIKRGKPLIDEATASRLQKVKWVIDTRDEKTFKKGHLSHSINLMEGNKYETWLGSIIQPGERFYLAAANEEKLQSLVIRTAAIGYESQIIEAFVLDYGEQQNPSLNIKDFKAHQQAYTIIDVRNPSEVKEFKPFHHSITIPLAELRDRLNEIPEGKPVVVHCAGGYRSAAASSIIQAQKNGNVKVFDLGESIKEFQEV